MKKILTIILLGLAVLFSDCAIAQKQASWILPESSNAQYSGKNQVWHVSQLIPLDKSFVPRKDSRIMQYYDSVRLLYQLYFNDVAAEALNDLGNEAPDGTLANILTDALLQAGATEMQSQNAKTPDLALLNFGGIREPIPAGPITIGKIFSVLPFDNNNLVIVDVKGSELRKMFFNNLRELKNVQSFSAGVRLVYKGGILDSVTINGKPLDDNRTYRMATINFVENGGDKILADVKTKNIFTQTQPFRTTMIEYFKAKGKFRGVKDGRVTIIK